VNVVMGDAVQIGNALLDSTEVSQLAPIARQ
jgi:hypothetical protein